ncbi:MAG: glycogen/starch/alpha-glucan family phosphorylase [Candidatus Scatovivens sp.]
MQMYTIDQQTLKEQYLETARTLFGKELKELNPYELNAVIANVVKSKVISSNYENSKNLYSEKRIAIYFSIEFLMGRIVLDMLTNAGLMKITTKIFAEEGIDINCLEEVSDTALGNGGLGRLAACFIESAATKGYPLYGVGLYYKYGLFKQEFDKTGNQIEKPDKWTEKGESWFEAQEEDAVTVEYQDTKVKAVPYVMPIVGYNSSREHFDSNAFPLTLWKAEPIEGITNESASKISDYLYPDDSTDEGKRLRIRQEYFFVSAMLQRIFNIHLKKHGTLDNIEDYYIFQMNDTHPVMACLEFIRLLKNHGYSINEAFEKAKKCFAYTNHTIMSEALEKWSIILFKDLLPNIFKVVEELNQILIDELIGKDEFYISTSKDGKTEKYPNWQLVREYELFADGLVHMSRIACFVACKINGVAAVHTEIIKNETLGKWYKLYPEKFNNKTNGVTPRRWLKLANHDLANFLDCYLGKDWVTDLTKLEKLEQYKNDSNVLAEYAAVKNIAKKNLAEYIKKQEGIQIDSSSIIDCQVKRIHEYKRQLMNALRILYIYDKLKKGELTDFYKTTFVIGGKAAASYNTAKSIIALIKDIQDMVNNDPDVNDKMQVVFLTNFNVSYAEKVYAGANFSEQISTAGTEASGTSNMKFMMNGAPTIGTLDGANIEILEEAGSKNNYIFGATVDELKRIKPIYNHQSFLAANSDLVELIEYLKGARNLKGTYWNLANTLLYNDRYFIMYDLRSYIETTLKANKDYSKEQSTGDLSFYTRKGFKNTTHVGKFSSDRTIKEYAEDIWHI